MRTCVCLTVAALAAGIGVVCAPSARATLMPAARQQDVRWAEKAFKQGNYKEALAYYQLYLNRELGATSTGAELGRSNSNPKHIELATVRRGECLFHLGDYQKAVEVFHDYLRQYAGGKYYNNVRAALEVMESRVFMESDERRQLLEALEPKINQLLLEMGDAPALEQRARLMELYWSAGQYKQALDQYDVIVAQQPNYFQVTTGVYVVPEVVASAERAAGNLLAVTNVRKRVELVTNYYGNRREVVVTAQLENQSTQLVRHAQLNVTLYDFFDRTIDSRLLQVHNLSAGGRRSLMVRFDSFDDNFNNAYNVGRVAFEIVSVDSSQERVVP